MWRRGGFRAARTSARYLALVIARANSVLRMRRSSGAYIVLRVHLEESDRLHRGENVVKMRGLSRRQWRTGIRARSRSKLWQRRYLPKSSVLSG